MCSLSNALRILFYIAILTFVVDGKDVHESEGEPVSKEMQQLIGQMQKGTST